MDVKKKLKIFVHPIEGAGHINACIGLAQALAYRGHDVHFVVDSSFKGQFTKYGYFKENLLVSNKKLEQVSGDNPMKNLVEHIQTSDLLSNIEPIEKIKCAVDNSFMNEMVDKMIEMNGQLEQMIDSEKPDLIIVDNPLIEPTIWHSKIPWIMVCSGNPLLLYYETKKLPPCLLGLPIDSDPVLWESYRKIVDSCFMQKILDKQNKMFEQCNYPKVDKDTPRWLTSKFMNIYGYPEELDYGDVLTRPDHFVRVDAFCRKECEPFQLPEDFKQKIMPKDKLIYLSMGSMGGIDLDLMRRLILILANTPHKYIVSKGPLHEEFQLADNMWGKAFLPQTAILPLVDLVITHGGNNTVTETFNFGKPMIVMPLFADQYDNAQRIQEKGFGVRINPFKFDDNVLIESIDKLLFDTELNHKLKLICQRIQQSNSKEKACIAMEQMVEKYRMKSN